MAQAPARCLQHPERNAVARCKTCHKPLCQGCVMKKPGGIFCSDDCFEKMGDFQRRVEKLDERKVSTFSFRSLVKWVIVTAVVLGVVYFVFVKEGVRTVEDLIRMVKGFIP